MQYILDVFKYKLITEKYMAGLGIFSKREKANANYRQQIEALVPKNFSTEFYDNEEVKSLIDFPNLEKKHRETLARISDNKINETAQQFLEDYKTQIKRVQQNLDSLQQRDTVAENLKISQQKRRKSTSVDPKSNRKRTPSH